ncbi:MAG: hypothetical protein JW918_20500 [Anaerolineae bacterium]|nr:hypothetical protein [Anaerolineae bacterium]
MKAGWLTGKSRGLETATAGFCQSARAERNWGRKDARPSAKSFLDDSGGAAGDAGWGRHVIRSHCWWSGRRSPCALVRWEEGDYIPSAYETALHLGGTPADGAISLNWTVDVTLPPTGTWRIAYYSQTVASTVVATDSLTNTARSHVLTGLENYQAYTVTLSLNASQAMSDTACVMPTDIFVYLPIVWSEYRTR